MPIASGAAGRVDAGIDTSTTWTPDGVKRKTKPPNRSCNSYLQRYQEQRKKNKSNSSQRTQVNTDVIDQGNEGDKERGEKEKVSDDDPTPGKPLSGNRKKSVLCVLF